MIIICAGTDRGGEAGGEGERREGARNGDVEGKRGRGRQGREGDEKEMKGEKQRSGKVVEGEINCQK